MTESFIFAKIDVNLPDHPKFIGLSVDAKWAFIEAILYCRRLRTDGAIPLARTITIGQGVVGELVVAGLWQIVEDEGYFVHDYNDWNNTRAEIDVARETRRRGGEHRVDKAGRTRDGRLAAGADGGAENTSPAEPVQGALLGVQVERGREREESEGEAQFKTLAQSAPAPVSDRADQPGPTYRDNPLYTVEFERFWVAYPVKLDKARAAKAYDTARHRASPEDILAGVARYVDELGHHPQREIKYAQGWLNGERWLDEPTSPDRSLASVDARGARGSEHRMPAADAIYADAMAARERESGLTEEDEGGS